MVYIYRVPSDMPLYDILNEFQKGSSHMAAVVKAREKGKETPQIIDEEKYEENKSVGGDSQLTTPLLQAKSETVVVDIDKPSKLPIITKQTSLQHGDGTNSLSSENIEDGEVIGIITLEDVFEELLQVSFCLLRYSSPPVFNLSSTHRTYYNCLLGCRRKLWMRQMNMLTFIRGKESEDKLSKTKLYCVYG